jgi:isoleucyl-tRNA synthetase
MQLCAVELSALYFDVIKDRLYTWRKDGKERRSAQTVLWIVAQDVIRLLAPVLSFTATEAWGHLPGRPVESVFLAGLPARERPRDAEALEARYGRLFEVRGVVQGKLEEARRAKLIGSGLEAMVTVSAEGEQLALLEEARAELPTLFIVSKVVLARGPLSVEVTRAPGVKCERCWIFAEDVGVDPKHPTLCAKCAGALS